MRPATSSTCRPTRPDYLEGASPQCGRDRPCQYDGRVVTYIGPPVNLHPDVEMAAGCRRDKLARGLDLEQANVARQVAHLAEPAPAPLDGFRHDKSTRRRRQVVSFGQKNMAPHIFQSETELQNIAEAAPSSRSFSVSEKLAHYGSSALSGVEHLRLLVGKDSIADALLRHFGSLKALSRASFKELRQFNDHVEFLTFKRAAYIDEHSILSSFAEVPKRSFGISSGMIGC